MPRHQVSTLTIDESLSLRVGGQMDGEVGFSDLNCADLAISSLPYLTCFSRLAIAIWKDDGRVKPEEALVVEVQGGACR